MSAALIWAFNDRWLDANGISYWYRSDPICTFLFSILVLWSTTGTIQEAVHVLMAGVPRGVDPSAVLAQLHEIPTVVEVHDLHVWTLVGSKRNMWAHIMVEPGADSTPVILAAQRVARAHNCMHTCFQVEDSGRSLARIRPRKSPRRRTARNSAHSEPHPALAAGTYDKSIEGDACFHT
eukprot:4245605-Prymnesium_polylepis.1